MNLFDLSNKVCLVTGSLGLLGKAHCKALAMAGAKVIVSDLNGKLCTKFAENLGNSSIGLSLDITSQSSIDKALELIIGTNAKIDVLINNASINEKVEDTSDLDFSNHQPDEFDIDDWHKLLNVNLTGTYMLTRSVGKYMCQQKFGSIINIASTYGVVAPNQDLYKDRNGKQVFVKSPAYPATKSGVISLTTYFASFYGKYGVRVNSLSPGGVLNGQNTDFIKNYSDRTLLKRMADPEDYMGSIIFLSSDASSYMTGANLIVDGGYCSI